MARVSLRHATYLRFEIVRTLRNRRFLVFSLAFPLVLFFAIAGPNKNGVIDGVPLRLYVMSGMATWGAMVAVISSGARIAQERSVGWTRQMRITPLSTRAYFTAKVLSGYLIALFSIAALSISGTALGVRMSAAEWATFVIMLLVGLVPIAILGVMLGHLLSVDVLGPATGGITSLLALLGGSFGPLVQSGIVLTIIKWVPSYWLVQAGRSAVKGTGWPPSQAWIVFALWSVVLGRLAAIVYRRDTNRV
jgi:ABC-2 type transport system permease protein